MTPTSKELRLLAKHQAFIERKQMEFLRLKESIFSGLSNGKVRNGKFRKPRKMSAAGRRAIAKAQRKRWAAYHRNNS